MNLTHTSVGMTLPAPSLAERVPALSSRGHASGHVVVGRGKNKRVVLVESDLEFKWAILLDADQDVQEIKEQVEMNWCDQFQIRKHFFDFYVTMRSGRTAALIVKPAKRARRAEFIRETREIAEEVARTGFADETRVLTDECIDPILLQNARFLRSVCENDPEADLAAKSVAVGLRGAVPLSELTARINLGARGFRALVRKIATGKLVCIHHEAIGLSTLVQGGHLQ